MVTELNLETPVGSQLIDMFDNKYNVIGVVKDFYFESFLGEVRPLVFVKGKGRGTVSAKIEGSDLQAAISSIELLWNKINPTQSIRYRFMDIQFANMYDGLHRAKTIFLVFSVLSIIVACLGLFALSMFMMEQRGKEISVRKVLGASSTKLYTLLTVDFMKLVLVAIGIAIPISWYFIQFLLDGMVNRIAITWELFAFSGAIALLIAMITISYESLKATLVNPAQKLRSE